MCFPFVPSKRETPLKPCHRPALQLLSCLLSHRLWMPFVCKLVDKNARLMHSFWVVFFRCVNDVNSPTCTTTDRSASGNPPLDYSYSVVHRFPRNVAQGKYHEYLADADRVPVQRGDILGVAIPSAGFGLIATEPVSGKVSYFCSCLPFGGETLEGLVGECPSRSIVCKKLFFDNVHNKHRCLLGLS